MRVRFSGLHGLPVDGSGPGNDQIADLYFDDRTWQVSEVVVTTGHWPRQRRQLVDRDGIAVTRRAALIDVAIRRGATWYDDDALLPVSRRMELRYRDYLRSMMCWFNGFVVSYQPPPPPTTYPEAPDAHLRSARAVLGHHVLARDGEMGHVADFIIEVPSWTICDVVVRWGIWPRVHEGSLSPNWVREVSWARSSVDIVVRRRDVLRSA